MQKLYKENFSSLLEKVKLDLKKWKTIYFSLAGKVNSIKINVLPKFLYLFQCSTFLNPFYTCIDKAFISFTWNGKNPRMRIEILQRPKQGGLALPNLATTIEQQMLKKLLIDFMLQIRTGVTMKLDPAVQHLLQLWSLPVFQFLFHISQATQSSSTAKRYGFNLDGTLVLNIFLT